MNPQTRSFIYNCSAVLVLSAAVLYLTHWTYAPFLYAFGTAGLAVCYLTAPYRQLDFRRRRLHRFNILAGILMVVSSALMFRNRTEWILCLTIAAIFQVYTAFATPKE